MHYIPIPTCIYCRQTVQTADWGSCIGVYILCDRTIFGDFEEPAQCEPKIYTCDPKKCVPIYYVVLRSTDRIFSLFYSVYFFPRNVVDHSFITHKITVLI